MAAAPKTWPGLALAAAILGAWAAAHIYGVFDFTLTLATLPLAVALIALQTWLYAGMFIVAHDTMHGSILPKHPKLNAALGQLILAVYAGFNWRKMRTAHHQHHKTPGTADDPDFNAANPRDFWGWYYKWFMTYFSWPQFVFLLAVSLIYLLVFNAAYVNIVVFWAVPAILSSMQLFYFGTYLPHREGEAFPDHHNARTNNYGYLASLLSCFHFGYHHEHHLYPHEPWWRLPARRRESL